MNSLMPYDNKEEENMLGKVTTTELSWLAPPPRQVNGTLDHEWGLGKETSSSEPGEGSNPALVAKLGHFHELKQKGTHFNQSLNNNRSFRNPHIYAKLVDWIGVDENTSGYAQLLRKHDKPVDRQEAEKVWSSSPSARKALKRQAGAERIAEMQKRQQEESDKAKMHRKRERIDFAPASSTSTRESDRHESGSRHHSSESSRRRARDAERYRESHRHRDRRDHRRD